MNRGPFYNWGCLETASSSQREQPGKSLVYEQPGIWSCGWQVGMTGLWDANEHIVEVDEMMRSFEGHD